MKLATLLLAVLLAGQPVLAVTNPAFADPAHPPRAFRAPEEVHQALVLLNPVRDAGFELHPIVVSASLLPGAWTVDEDAYRLDDGRLVLEPFRAAGGTVRVQQAFAGLGTTGLVLSSSSYEGVSAIALDLTATGTGAFQVQLALSEPEEDTDVLVTWSGTSVLAAPFDDGILTLAESNRAADAARLQGLPLRSLAISASGANLSIDDVVLAGARPVGLECTRQDVPTAQIAGLCRQVAANATVEPSAAGGRPGDGYSLLVAPHRVSLNATVTGVPAVDLEFVVLLVEYLPSGPRVLEAQLSRVATDVKLRLGASAETASDGVTYGVRLPFRSAQLADLNERFDGALTPVEQLGAPLRSLEGAAAHVTMRAVPLANLTGDLQATWDLGTTRAYGQHYPVSGLVRGAFNGLKLEQPWDPLNDVLDGVPAKPTRLLLPSEADTNAWATIGSAGTTLTPSKIRAPLWSVPAFVAPGDTLRVELASGFVPTNVNASLVPSGSGQAPTNLTFLSGPVVEASRLWTGPWRETVRAYAFQLPSSGVEADLYDLVVTGTLGSSNVTETMPNSVAVAATWNRNLSIAVLSDLNLRAEAPGNVRGLLDTLDLVHPDLVVVAGDVAFAPALNNSGIGPKDSFRNFTEQLLASNLTVPVLMVPGDKDLAIRGTDDGLRSWLSLVGPPYYSLDIGTPGGSRAPYHFVGLNTFDWAETERLLTPTPSTLPAPANGAPVHSPMGVTGGQVRLAQRQWLENDSVASAGRHLLLAGHHSPAWPMTSFSGSEAVAIARAESPTMATEPALAAVENSTWQGDGRRELLDLLERRGDAVVLSGHLRQDAVGLGVSGSAFGGEVLPAGSVAMVHFQQGPLLVAPDGSVAGAGAGVRDLVEGLDEPAVQFFTTTAANGSTPQYLGFRLLDLVNDGAGPVARCPYGSTVGPQGPAADAELCLFSYPHVGMLQAALGPAGAANNFTASALVVNLTSAWAVPVPVRFPAWLATPGASAAPYEVFGGDDDFNRTGTRGVELPARTVLPAANTATMLFARPGTLAPCEAQAPAQPWVLGAQSETMNISLPFPRAVAQVVAEWRTLGANDSAWAVFATFTGSGLATLVNATLPMGEGLFEVRCRASDAFGHAFAQEPLDVVVDLTTPSIAVTTPSEDEAFGVATLTLNFTVTEGPDPAAILTVVCGLDGAAPVACASGQPLASLTEGNHTLRINATDPAGRLGAAQVNFSVDLSAPEVVAALHDADGADDGVVSQGDVVVNLTVRDDHLLALTCQVDAGAPVACASLEQHVFENLTEGNHTARVNATDVFQRSTVAEVAFAVDLNAPAILIESPVEGAPLGDALVPVVFSVVDVVGADATCRLDAGDPVPCEPPGHPFQDVADGDHTVTVFAEDAFGRNATASRNFSVDLLAPEVDIEQPEPDEILGSSSLTIQFQATDANLEEVTCQLDDGEPEPCEAPEHPFEATLAEGNHTVRVNATDLFERSTLAEVLFSVDATAPSLEVEHPANGTFVATALVDVVIGSDDPFAVLTCVLDGVALEACGFPGPSIGPLEEGTHAFFVEAVDRFDRASNASSTFHVDLTAPTVVLTAPLEGEVLFAPVLAEFQATDANLADVDCILDGETLDCTGLTNRTLEAGEGNHSLVVEARDLAANRESRTVNFTVDLSAPVVTVLEPEGLLDEADVTVRFTADDRVAHVTCYLDGAATGTDCSSRELLLEDLGQGLHEVLIEALDTGGRLGNATASFTVDTLPPGIAVHAPANGSHLPSATVEVNFTVTEDHLANVTCALDGAAPAPCEAPFDLEGLAEGPHTLRIAASDVLEHEAAVDLDFTVDLTDPVVTLTVAAVSGTENLTATLALVEANLADLSCSVDGGNASACDGLTGHVFRGLAHGPHFLHVVASDQAGRRGDANVSIVVDLLEPVVTITSPAAGVVLGVLEVPFAFDLDGTGSAAGAPSCTLDGADLMPCAAGNLTLTTFGTHVLEVSVLDAAGHRGNATREVVIAPPALVRVVPGSATLGPGATVDFDAAAFAADGQHIAGLGATWEASNGTITSSGLFTAPADPQSVRVNATIGGVKGQAVVQVTSVQAPAGVQTAVAPAVSETPTGSVTYVVGFAQAGAGAVLDFQVPAANPGELLDATLVLGQAASNLSIALETSFPAEAVPGEVNVTNLTEVLAAQRVALGLYLAVSGSEEGQPLNATRLNEVLDEMNVHLRMEQAFFRANGLSPSTGRLLEYSDGVLVGSDITLRLEGNQGSAFYRFTADLQNFSAFAIVWSPTRTGGGGGGGSGGSGDPTPPPACSDARDNDADGKVDASDPGCASATDNDETDPSGERIVPTAVDLLPPHVEGVEPAADAWTNNPRPLVRATFRDDLGVARDRTTVWLDGAPVQGIVVTASEVTFVPTDPLSEGQHTVRVVVADEVGNRNEALWSFWVDTGAPFVGLVEPADGAAAGARPTLTARFGDALSGVDLASVRLVLDGVEVLATREGDAVTHAPASDLAPGRHTALVEVADIAGNTATHTWTFVVAQAAPRGVPLDGWVALMAVAAALLLVGRRRG